ncbi:TetR/AcrR family transcriptional regulator [Luteimonas fraxinea]|uniref:TetR/AcrR family transcriptional regulator n=1 Tax=Luteimonas fraxinea TaxID=2901869 RepID=UPI001E3464BA|nr:TetR/AcrR family transcriptional regulator [Luteimonas fraxinea]MCD9125142.1 TetR/AcrR family transcriptional regulator [Luteimonas fraxinea]
MRATLLRAGLEVMSRKGVAATTIDDVIRQANVARGSFYKYFGGVPELASAIGVAVAQEMILALEDEMDRIPDPAARLATGLTGVFSMARRHPLLARFLVRSGWPVDDFGGLFPEKIGSAITQGIAEGRFVDMPLHVAMALVGGIAMGCMHAIAEGVAHEAAASAVGVVLRGLGVDSAQAARIAAASDGPLEWKTGPLLDSLVAAGP